MTGTTRPTEVLVIGDPYLSSTALASRLDSLDSRITLSRIDIDRTDTPEASSADALSEYVGSPDFVAEAIAARQPEVVVVHGAPVNARALSIDSLRLVCCARGGPVNIDLGAARDHGIPVTNTPGKNATAVAELTITFALNLIRGVAPAAGFLKAGHRLASAFDGAQFFGFECSEVALGLVGFGAVGRAVAQRATTLGMTVIAHDPAVAHATGNVEVTDDLDEVLAKADIVSLHARASANNRHLIGPDQFAMMRSGSYLINTARESLVDESALLGAIRSGRLSGAALDVLEPSNSRNPLLDERTVLVTPHIGGATTATGRRASQMVLESVTAYLERDSLPYLVDSPAETALATGQKVAG